MSRAILPAASAMTVPAARVAQIKKTAQQFEAIFVRQMLSAAHKSDFGKTVTSSKGADSFLDMQDARYADIASQKGAFGLAKMIEQQLMRREAQGTISPNPPPLGEVAARRAEPAPAKAGGGGASVAQRAPSPGLRRDRLTLREPPPPGGEDLVAHGTGG